MAKKTGEKSTKIDKKIRKTSEEWWEISLPYQIAGNLPFKKIKLKKNCGK